MRYLDPKNDLTFKKVFGQHPHLLRSFLNALLPLKEGGEQRGEQKGERKQAIATARCMKAKGFDTTTIAELTGLSVAEVELL